VPKNDVRIEAYGSVDELNSYIGLIRVQKINNDDKAFLEWIQRCLMTVAAVFASDYPDSKAIVVLSRDLKKRILVKLKMR